ncbi:MAG: CCA tRNA nucleotidyltransferase [Nanoarchaeota archaeon]|nr:CCA tRNA nucleotidyltransferase [Nanoarchaeota archaeon]
MGKNDVLRSVLSSIRPSKIERDHAEMFALKLIMVSKQISKSYSIEPMFVGSYEKNTWLAGNDELDLFLLFSPSTHRKKLEEQGLEIAKKIINQMGGTYQKKYSEHPYLCATVKFEGIEFDVDIVPCYDIKELKKIKSAVDRTPHHVRFVKKNLLLPDEVRLLKQFCKAAGIYGADVKTNGFSGYLCELMIINYGKFENCIKDAIKWRAPTVMTITEMDKKKLIDVYKGPFIVIDPVDLNRNVAAAVSIENFYKFIEAARKYMNKPSEKLFFPDKVKSYSVNEIGKEIANRGTRWYAIKFDKPDVTDDILYPQMRRCENIIEKIMNEDGFEVMRKDFYVGELCVMLFEMENWEVPRVFKNIGPNIYTKHAEEFLKHYKDRKIFLEGEYWAVELERKYTTALHLLKDLVSNTDAKLKEKGIPSKIVSNFKNASVVSGSDMIKLIEKLPEDFRVFMRNWFEKDIDIV